MARKDENLSPDAPEMQLKTVKRKSKTVKERAEKPEKRSKKAGKRT